MSIEIVKGITKKPVASGTLVQCISSLSLNGFLYIGHPTIPTTEGPYTMDALLISKEIGIVIIDLIEGETEQDYDLRQDDSANKLESLLRTTSELMRGRDLLIPVQTISFGPALLLRRMTNCKNNGHFITNSENLLLEQLRQLPNWNDQKRMFFQRHCQLFRMFLLYEKIRKREMFRSQNQGEINSCDWKSLLLRLINSKIEQQLKLLKAFSASEVSPALGKRLFLPSKPLTSCPTP